MIEQQARVVATDADYVWVSVTHQTGCQSCELKQGCGTGSLGKLLGHRESSFKLPAMKNLKIGDKVVVGIPDHSYLLASALVYLLPLFLFFACAAVVDALVGSDLFTMLSALFGLGAGLLLAKRFSQRYFAHSLQPKILRQIW